ncbi:MAG: hypothetical protein QGH37_32425 [Candidatus Poribacteria bacterium]|nr:hypothetical protein [Candidatus Poribacteria bacterium]MDP6997339.1 hypothetical protein [Candidatus Poribacteria bacterium]
MRATTFKAALLALGAISGAGWNAPAYDGLKAIEKELSAKSQLYRIVKHL